MGEWSEEGENRGLALYKQLNWGVSTRSVCVPGTVQVDISRHFGMRSRTSCVCVFLIVVC